MINKCCDHLSTLFQKNSRLVLSSFSNLLPPSFLIDCIDIVKGQRPSKLIPHRRRINKTGHKLTFIRTNKLGRIEVGRVENCRASCSFNYLNTVCGVLRHVLEELYIRREEYYVTG